MSPNPRAAAKPLAPIVETIRQRTTEFCRASLTEEYTVLCDKLIDVLARRRPSPFMKGRPDTWACAVTYAIGSVNFLFDPSQDPHVPAKDLCAAFGVSQSAAYARSRLIQDLLRILPLDPRWTLPSKLVDNPRAWMIMVNGFIVDARRMSRQVQEDAYRRGLIPFVPD